MHQDLRPLSVSSRPVRSPFRLLLGLTVFALLVPGAGGAAVFTVGPNGAYSATDLQTAIDDALASPALNDEVKIQAGVVAFGFAIPDAPNGFLFVSGGWDASFSTQGGPEETHLLDGDPTVSISVTTLGGVIEVSNLTIRGTTPGKRGVQIQAEAGVTQLADVIVRDFDYSASGSDFGGVAVEILALGADTTVNLYDSLLTDNSATTDQDDTIVGGALRVEAEGDSTVRVRGVTVANQLCTATDPGALVVGCAAEIVSDGEVVVSENTFENTSVQGGAPTLGVSSYLSCVAGTLTADNNRWIGGGGAVSPSVDASVFAASLSDSCTMSVRSSLVVDSKVQGLHALSITGGNLHVTNLTVADNLGPGLVLDESGGDISLGSTISFANGDADIIDPTVDQRNNLLGVDPLFLDPEGGHYQFRVGSPALDAGTNNPPGGLTTEDLAGNPRVAGGIVDVGAYEGAYSDVMTVGTSLQADWSSLQAALDAAVGTLWDDVIRIQAENHDVNLDLVLDDGTKIELSGGWDETFQYQTDDPAVTVLNGRSLGRVLQAELAGSELEIGNLTIAYGRAHDSAGARIDGDTNDRVTLRDVRFVENLAEAIAAVPNYAGGLLVNTSGLVVAENVEAIGNVVLGEPDQIAIGGGLYLSTVAMVLRDLTVRDNQVSAGTALGGGLYLSGTTIELSGSTIADNVVVGSAAAGSNGVIGVFGSTVLENNRWERGSGDTGGAQLVLAVEDGTVSQRSSLIADGEGLEGLNVALATDDCSWNASNLTLVGNSGTALSVDGSPTPGAVANLSNSVLVGNGTDAPQVQGVSLTQLANRVGSDPGFVNPVEGFYQLVAASPALDAGDNSPPGGLSAVDLAGEERVQNLVVDQGAYEGTSLIFATGFETGDLSIWSSSSGGL